MLAPFSANVGHMFAALRTAALTSQVRVFLVIDVSSITSFSVSVVSKLPLLIAVLHIAAAVGLLLIIRHNFETSLKICDELSQL
jgi:hypothetical protein